MEGFDMILLVWIRSGYFSDYFRQM